MSDKIPKQLEHKEIVKCTPKGKYVGNNRCHANCLSYALRHPEKVQTVIGVAQVFGDNTTCAHFILKLVDGSYFDPTYGNMSEVLYSHNVVIEEYKVEGFNPNRELQGLKDYLFSMRSWIYRLTHSNCY